MLPTACVHESYCDRDDAECTHSQLTHVIIKYFNVDGQSIARQRLSKHVITQAIVEERVFACRCWVTKHQRIRQLAKRGVATVAMQLCDKHATIETEMFSVWSVRRLYNEFQMKPDSVRVFSSVGVLCQFQTRSELVTRQEARKQDTELLLGAHKNTRDQPVKN
jgi:hypothetical protein